VSSLKTADSIYRYLHEGWGIPLLAVGEGDALDHEDPCHLLKISLDIGDIRLIRALPLWISLLDNIPPADASFDEKDRRRIAYLCDVGCRLEALRNSLTPGRKQSWTVSIMGLSPRAWEVCIPLVQDQKNQVAQSDIGHDWGILEPMDFSQYARFQKQFLTVRSGHGR